VKYPMGLLDDVSIKVGDLYVLIDFMILEMEEDTLNPIILRRLFLATAGCCIDVKNGKLSFHMGDDHVDFNLFKAAKFPFNSDECNKIDVVNGLIWETMSNLDSNNPLNHLMLNDDTTKDENREVSMCAQILEASPPIPPSLVKVEPLEVENKPSSDKAQAPKAELKPLLSSLRYKFLGPNSTFPVIVNVSLNASFA